MHIQNKTTELLERHAVAPTPEARKIADIIFTYAHTEAGRSDISSPWLEDRRKELVNCYYNKTKSGYFLELYYEQPGYLWTPEGTWNFAGSGSGSWDKIMPEVLARFDAEEILAHYTTEMGEYGPVYALHSIDGEPLPTPEI